MIRYRELTSVSQRSRKAWYCLRFGVTVARRTNLHCHVLSNHSSPKRKHRQKLSKRFLIIRTNFCWLERCHSCSLERLTYSNHVIVVV